MLCRLDVLSTELISLLFLNSASLNISGPGRFLWLNVGRPCSRTWHKWSLPHACHLDTVGPRQCASAHSLNSSHKYFRRPRPSRPGLVTARTCFSGVAFCILCFWALRTEYFVRTTKQIKIDFDLQCQKVSIHHATEVKAEPLKSWRRIVVKASLPTPEGTEWWEPEARSVSRGPPLTTCFYLGSTSPNRASWWRGVQNTAGDHFRFRPYQFRDETWNPKSQDCWLRINSAWRRGKKMAFAWG